MKTYRMPIGSKYLSDQFETLPYGICDKGSLGCGGTTLAITDKYSTIIFVPYISLVENKKNQHPDLIEVKAGVTVSSIRQQIEESLQRNGKFKIMATYNAITKLDKVIDEYRPNILVDEFHLLQLQYSFRNDAVKPLIDKVKDYPKTTLLTATPIAEEWTINSLKHIPRTEIIWENAEEIKVDITSSNRPLAIAKKIAKEHIQGKREGDAYIFINSIKNINSVIKSANLKEKDVRIICSENRTRGASEPIYKQSTINDPSKKVNFLTSVGFAGVDIYNNSGRAYLIVCHEAHTKIDPQSIVQAAGRIRDSKYFRNRIEMVIPLAYANLYNTKINLQEFIDSEKRNIEEAKEICEDYNNMPERTRQRTKNSPVDYIYKDEKTNTFHVNEDEIVVNIYRVLVESGMYKNKVLVEESLNNIGVLVNQTKDDLIDTFDKVVNGKRIAFKEELEEYIKIKLNKFNLSSNIIYEDRYPLLDKGWDLFNTDIIKYRTYKELESAIFSKSSNVSTDYKVFKKLETCIHKGRRYTNKQLKEELQKVYNDLGLNLKAKSTDIEKYYHVKESRTKNDRGYEIINSKLIIK